MLRHPYIFINAAFIVIILGIMLYSVIFTPDRSYHPLPSVYKEITGNEPVSTGLSRSFSAIVRLDLRKAIEYNPFGVRIFLFFIVQLLFRINFFMIARRRTADVPLIILDIALSVGVFIIAFWPFLVNAVKAMTGFPGLF
ncbi:MAG: DUF2752 domain-containing protein [Bacteroidales bacterium]|nr:DUF2752 domain-containing protein [Bacteroidales bacterium]